MRTPIGWLRDYVDLPSDTATIVERLAMLGFPVEGIERRPSLSGVVVGRIATLGAASQRRPAAGLHDRRRRRAQQLTIATAATNVAAGQIVPVATIGAQLVRDGESLVIEPRKMRGLDSQGMLCQRGRVGLRAGAGSRTASCNSTDSLPLGADVIALFRLDRRCARRRNHRKPRRRDVDASALRASWAQRSVRPCASRWRSLRCEPLRRAMRRSGIYV